jgi:hypothetical protein
VSPGNGRPHPSDDQPEIGEAAAALLRQFGRTESLPDRESILAAFKRNPSPPQPSTPQHQPQERQAEPEARMTDDAWRFILEGYVAGNLAWATRHGPPPKTEGCRVPGRILREFGL